MYGFSVIVSFEMRRGLAEARRVVARLRLLKIVVNNSRKFAPIKFFTAPKTDRDWENIKNANPEHESIRTT